jgi:hypothetical protein
MRNGEERRVTKSCSDGEFFSNYLTTIRVLLNGSTEKALIKMQSLHDLFFFVFLCFFKNVKRYGQIEHGLNHYFMSEMDKSIYKKNLSQKRTKQRPKIVERTVMSTTDEEDDPLGDDEPLRNDELLAMMDSIEEQEGSAEK